MKNIIVLICDSLSYSEDMLTDMPLLKKRKDNMILFTNYYSEAPFTDAAIVPIMTGSRVLDNNGYINNIKDHKYNINEIFKKEGFFTYNTLWNYPNTLSFLRGLDEYHYMGGGFISSLYNYRIKYFQELHKKEKFSSTHFDMLHELLKDFFIMANIYVEDLEKKNYRFELIKKHTKFNEKDFDKFILEIIENNESFESDPQKYIYKLLNNDNNFFKDEYFSVIYSDEFIKNEKHLKRKTKRVLRRQFYHSVMNSRNNKLFSTFVHMLKNYKKDVPVNNLKSWVLNTVKHNGDFKTDYLSGKVIIENTLNHLELNKDKNNFIITHIHDNHSPLNFFTREQNNYEQEFTIFNTHTKKINKKKNIFYSLSKKYVDKQIDDMIKTLDDKGFLDDTTIIITSDHGSSFVGEIFRNEITNSFYDENYRIPLMIYENKLRGYKNNNFGTSSQFIPTLLDFFELKEYNDWIKSDSLLKKNRKEIMFEYFGSGCPDYIFRDRMFSVKNAKYKVNYTYLAKSDYVDGTIESIYNLEKDPYEKNNLVDKRYDMDEVQKLIKIISKRNNELNKERSKNNGI